MIHGRSLLKTIGPGVALAATGVGAGDLVAASVAGAQFGVGVLWAAVVGAMIKYFLNEGVARRQLATGTTLLEGWVRRLHPAVSIYFLIYLLLWSFIVAGALISACGLCALLLPKVELVSMVPAIPKGSRKSLLGVIGGVGGSVTLLSYSYWMREKGWTSTQHSSLISVDLRIAYILTGLFGVGMIIISAGVTPRILSGTSMVLEVSLRIGDVLGPVGRWMFLIGFWGAVFTSLFGVWQSIPYLFDDLVRQWKPEARTSSIYYNGIMASCSTLLYRRLLFSLW